MKITDLTNRNVHISARSLTVRDDYGTTCGVVTGVKTWDKLHPRDQFDYRVIIGKSGLWGSKFDLMKQVVFDAKNKIYFLNNLKRRDAYEKYFKGKFPEDEQRYLEYAAAVERIRANGINVIDCYLE